jgi:aryl-alcohol dehydrogenase-like predicted oxidoreductase
MIAEAFAIAADAGLAAPTMEQPQYNLFERERVEREYAPLYAQHGLGTTTFSPLASGLLSGKYGGGGDAGGRLGAPEFAWLDNHVGGALGRRRVEAVRRLAPIAAELGCSTAQLAIAWCLGNPDVSSVILGASRVGQLEENLAALAVADRLDLAGRQRIEAALAG